MIDISLQKKLNKLTGIIQSYSAVAVAFSGGSNSAFLLKHAHNILGRKAVAVTAVVPNFSADEIEDSINFCTAEGIMHLLVNMGESFMNDPVDQCDISKNLIFKTMLAHPGLDGMVLVDGTNVDGTFDLSMGEEAHTELGVYSPLREAGLCSNDIMSALQTL